MQRPAKRVLLTLNVSSLHKPLYTVGSLIMERIARAKIRQSPIYIVCEEV